MITWIREKASHALDWLTIIFVVLMLGWITRQPRRYR